MSYSLIVQKDSEESFILSLCFSYTPYRWREIFCLRAFIYCLTDGSEYFWCFLSELTVPIQIVVNTKPVYSSQSTAFWHNTLFQHWTDTQVACCWYHTMYMGKIQDKDFSIFRICLEIFSLKKFPIASHRKCTSAFSNSFHHKNSHPISG